MPQDNQLTRYGIVDLHSHLPMHIDASHSGTPLEALVAMKGNLRDTVRSLALDAACHLANYPKDGQPAVTVPSLRNGHVGVALSVLYQPFDEMDAADGFAAAPRASYFQDLLAEMDRVEAHVRDHYADQARFVRTPKDLNQALDEGVLALVHAVEGGFHLGDTPAHVRENVAELARRGVGYITVAHLFWRRFASNAPALPFLSDATYRFFFPEPAVGLGALGLALVEAMIDHKIIVDVTHMTEQALWETLDLLPPGMPLYATHIACRSPKRKLAYNLSDEMIQRIAEHGGVMGIILCEHYANGGATADLNASVDVLARQIDHIRSVTSSDDNVAIGTDLDGFIKPTLTGLNDSSALKDLERALVLRYKEPLAEQICSGNALRVLLEHWLGGV